MPTLTVELKIPIETEPLIGAPALTFTRWLPLGKDKGIALSEDGIDFTFWFDIQATWWASQTNEEELSKHINVLAHYVKAHLTIADIDQRLADYMENRDFSRLPAESEKAIQSEYDGLGQRLLRVVIERVNRLISYARAFKGQYWLLEYNYDADRMHGYFADFKGRARIDNREWFRFQPGTGDSITIEMTPEEKYIDENEWDAIREFVLSTRRTPLVRELLSGAERLAANGYNRSALTEAVTALEVALSDFGRSQDAHAKLGSVCANRLGTSRLQSQIEHMGLTGTVGFLLPLLFPEEILPTNVLAGCRDAIALRQNVVHNGQRDVNEIKLSQAIASIRKCCDILRECANEGGETPDN